MRSFIRVVPRQPVTFVRTRTFATTRQLRLKEDADRSPQQVEEAKQKSMKQQEGSRDVASKSEEVVGADQEKVKDHDKHMEQLQKETAQQGEENHPKGKA